MSLYDPHIVLGASFWVLGSSCRQQWLSLHVVGHVWRSLEVWRSSIKSTIGDHGTIYWRKLKSRVLKALGVVVRRVVVAKQFFHVPRLRKCFRWLVPCSLNWTPPSFIENTIWIRLSINTRWTVHARSSRGFLQNWRPIMTNLWETLQFWKSLRLPCTWTVKEYNYVSFS